MLVDCETCTVRGTACGDCVVTLLLDTPTVLNSLGGAETRAIEVLARAGFEVTVLEPTHVEHDHHGSPDRPTGSRTAARRTGRSGPGWHAA